LLFRDRLQAQFHTLPAAAKDAQAIRDVLESVHGFNVVACVTGKQATKANIEAALDTAHEKMRSVASSSRKILLQLEFAGFPGRDGHSGVKPGSIRFLFYFAGHGIQVGCLFSPSSVSNYD
jgi:hypothetical protein